MANLRVNTIRNQDGTQGPTFDGNLEFSGTSHTVLPKGTTAQRPSGVPAGSIRYNTSTNEVEQYNGTTWVTLNSYAPGRGIFAGGTTGSQVNRIDYVTIATTGNATIFGDLNFSRSGLGGVSSSTRGIFAGGSNGPNRLSLMDYVTIASTGNATYYGDMETNRDFMLGCCSSSTRGVIAGSYRTPTLSNNMETMIIATTGNSGNFGFLIDRSWSYSSGCSSSTRGIFAGGSTGATSPFTPFIQYIQYITFSTLSDRAEYFGNLSSARNGPAICSSSTRGVFGGGYTPTNLNAIEYVEMSTLGNSLTFGNLTQTRRASSACSSPTRGVFGGGETPTTVNRIDYITIATTGNAITFGDLTLARRSLASLSDSHGGLV
jgi:hypothetical protein